MIQKSDGAWLIRSARAGVRALLVAACLGALAVAATPRGAAAMAAQRAAAPPPDPLQEILADDDFESRLADLALELKQGDVAPCERLGRFGDHRNERVREHAVRALSVAGCGTLASFDPYLRDPNPWVTEAVVRGVERQRVREAVPFLIDHLADRRAIVSGDGAWTIAESAHRALRALTCQSFHFEPQDSPGGQAEAVERFRSWYREHGSEPRETWIASGLSLARDYLGRDFAPHRREGLELLLLIGPPAAMELRAALGRKTGDLRASVTCQPAEPPRVSDRVPCTLLVTNAASRPVALVPIGEAPDVRLVRQDDGRAEDRGERPRGAPQGAAEMPALAARVIDLGPGDVLRRDFQAGPVRAAGRYEVRATLVDLATSLSGPNSTAPASTPPRAAKSSPARERMPRPAEIPGAASRAAAGPPAIEASTVLRFEP